MDRPRLIPIAVHSDHRGSHTKFFGATPEAIATPDYSIAEVFMTTNAKNVLRGLHFQTPAQPKLVQALTGAVRGNALCCDPDSAHFGTIFTFTLRATDAHKLFVPAYWALGYRALEDDTRILYLAGAPFNADGDVGIDPFDATLELSWAEAHENETEVRNAIILSERDQNLNSFTAYRALAHDGVTND